MIITSLRDDTVGTTVRGVAMDNIFNSFPTAAIVAGLGGVNVSTTSLTTPAAGDGGYIYIGGLSMTEYDPTAPFEGSLINNADISYMTRIEVQGGGIIDTGGTGFWELEKEGYAGPATQFNSAMMFTISDSNLNEFSDAAVFAHPESGSAADPCRRWFSDSRQPGRRAGLSLHVQRHDLELGRGRADQL